MTTPEERVQKMVESGAVAAEEGERLLAALHAPPPPRRYDAFERLGERAALGITAVVVAASVGLSRFGVRFDGLLDQHVGAKAPVPLAHALFDVAAGVLLPALVFFGIARAQSRHVRPVDLLVTLGVARVPGVVLAPFVAALAGRSVPAVVAVGLVLLAASVTLLYQGFRNASGLAGPRLGVSFVVALVVGETLSKLAYLPLH